VLIATGFRHSEVAFQLKLVEGAARRGAFGEYSRVIFKSHPFCPIDRVLAESKLPFRYEIEAAPLADLWATVDVAFVANSTSTAAEALYLRIPTAICAPADEMNLSPAFGCEGIIMVSSAAQLHAFLRDPQPSPWPADYLELNEDLPKWRRLLTV